MKQYSENQKKNYIRLINYIFILILFSVFTYSQSVDVVTIRLNNCSNSGEYYVDSNIYDNLSDLKNWGEFSNPQYRSQDYYNTSSIYFRSLLNGVGSSTQGSTYGLSPILAITQNYIYTMTMTGILYQIPRQNNIVYSNLSIYAQYSLSYASFGFSRYGISSMPLIINDSLYIGSADGYLYQLNATNISRLIGRYNTGGVIYSTPIYYNENIYIGSSSRYIYQLNATNVSKYISNYSTSVLIYSTPLIYNNILYVGMYDGYLYQLNASNINNFISRKYFIGNFTYSPSSYKDYLYISSNNYLFKINANNISDYTNVSLPFNIHNPIESNDYLYVADDYNYYQFNVSNISNYINKMNISTLAFYGTPIVANGYTYLSGIKVNTLASSRRGQTITQTYANNISNIVDSVDTFYLGSGTYDQSTTSSPLIYNSSIYFTHSQMVLGALPFVGFLDSLQAHDYVYYYRQQCPTFNYYSPTETNNSVINRNYLMINVSATNGTYNITFINIYIANKTIQLANYFTSLKELFLNYTPITNQSYYFNASVQDTKGNIVWLSKYNVTNLFIYVPVILGDCFDKIKNDNEIDIDYGGRCGRCKNFTYVSDDTSFQVLLLSNLISTETPFNETMCVEGDGVVMGYSFIIFLLIILIVILAIVLIIFLLIPAISFIIFGEFRIPFFNKKKKDTDENE